MSARVRASTRLRQLLARELEKYERSVGHQPSRDSTT
jgi:hypothetical protein